MDLQEVGWGGTDWIAPTQKRDRFCALVNEVTNLRAPYNAANVFTSCGQVSFSGRTLLHGVTGSGLHSVFL